MLSQGALLLAIVELSALLGFTVLLFLKEYNVFSDRTGVPSWSMTLADSTMFTLLNQLLFTIFIVLRLIISVKYERKEFGSLDIFLLTLTGIQFVLFMCVFVVQVTTMETAHLWIAAILILESWVRECLALYVRRTHMHENKYFYLHVSNVILLVAMIAFIITYMVSTFYTYMEYTTPIATFEFIALLFIIALPAFDIPLIDYLEESERRRKNA